MHERHAAPEPALDSGPFVGCEVRAGVRPQQAEELVQIILVREHNAGRLPIRILLHVGMPADPAQLARNILRAEDEIHDPGRYRAARHAVVPGCALLLREGDAALRLDGPETSCAVRGGAGENHSDRAMLPDFRQRLEEFIHRHVRLARPVPPRETERRSL